MPGGIQTSAEKPLSSSRSQRVWEYADGDASLRPGGECVVVDGAAALFQGADAVGECGGGGEHSVRPGDPLLTEQRTAGGQLFVAGGGLDPGPGVGGGGRVDLLQ
ncbi:hypothetical protein ACFQZC_32190 [Streptacidiphilus monticola]